MATTMNKSQCKSDLNYLERILNAKIEILDYHLAHLKIGIDINVIQLINTELQQSVEERAYLNYFPINENENYLQLTFIQDSIPNDQGIIEIIQLLYYPDFFNMWEDELLQQGDPFLFDRPVEQSFMLSPSFKSCIPELLEVCLAEKKLLVHEIKKQEIALTLFRASLESFFLPSEANTFPACTFLDQTSERDKVIEAREVILSRLSNPITIKELSKAVAMNECYLKKGFKAMFGKTIHEFQQFERIQKAKQLISLNKYPINEVAYMMGYNSHAHFSTSFKRITGLKPCELLG